MRSAAGETVDPALTAADFAAIGMTGVTEHNLATIIAEIAATSDDGSDVDTVSELSAVIAQAVADATAASLAVISAYDGTNTLPTVDDYFNAGTTGMNDTRLAPVNSIMEQVASSDSDTAAEIQAVIDAYSLILTAADSSPASGPVLALTAGGYATLALGTLDTSAEVGLMNSVLAGRSQAQVDTYAELAAIADVVSRMVEVAGGLIPSPAVTLDDLALIGITGLDETNLAQFLSAIADTADTGSDIDSLAEMQAIADHVVADQADAIALVAAYDGTNTAPSAATFTAIGIVGVDASNLTAINAYLATILPAGSDSVAEIQAIVDVYLKIYACADGIDNDNCAMTMDEFWVMGWTDIDTPEEVQALNDELDLLDWQVELAPVPTTGEIAAAVAARFAARRDATPRNGSVPDQLPTPSATPTPTPSPSQATPPAAPEPAPVTPTRPRPTKHPVVVNVSDNQQDEPVYPDAPVVGEQIPELTSGAVEAYVDGTSTAPVSVDRPSDGELTVVLSNGVHVSLRVPAGAASTTSTGANTSLRVTRGAVIRVNGGGFKPNSVVDIWIYSTPTHLGTVTTDGDGNFSAKFLVPKSVKIGEHTLKLDGIAVDGSQTTVATALTVVQEALGASPTASATPSAEPATPPRADAAQPSATGTSATPAVVLGIALLVLIALAFTLVALRRRRSAKEAAE